MMAINEQSDDCEPRDTSTIKRVALGLGGGIGLVLLAGMIVGFLRAASERSTGFTAIDFAIFGAMVIAMGALCWAIWKFWPSGRNEPISPSTKRSRNMMYVAIALGAIMGLYLATAGGLEPFALFSNGQVERSTAYVAIFGWLILTPIITYLWWRSIDEHEATAYRDSAFYAAHAYLFIVPAWWFAARAGLLPPQDPMIVLCAVAMIWCVVWLIKRYL